MCLVKMNLKKEILVIKNLCQELLSFLEEYERTPLSEKENELLDRDFG